MAWSEDGSRLISGSDDRTVVVWRYPGADAAAPLTVETQHRANIFGVHFLPCSGHARLVSAAMDHTVQLHELPPADMGSSYRLRPGSAAGGARGGGGMGGRGARQVAAAQRTTVYHCHRSRVKDVEVEPQNPHNFWSAAEDGHVRQFDTRVSTARQNDYSSPNVLVAVKGPSGSGPLSEVKGLDICKARPHLLALACGDPFVRLYDRRKLGPGTPASKAQAPQPVMMLAPAHLPTYPTSRYGRAHATYASFSNKGDKLVVTYHGDQAYCFDVSSAGCISQRYAPDGSSLEAAGAAGGLYASGPPANAGPYKWLDCARWRARSAAAGPSSAASASSSADASTSYPEGKGPASSSGGGASCSYSAGGIPEAGRQLPPAAEAAKVAGNRALFEQHFSLAIEHFSRALHLAPGSATLRLQRADALLSRSWGGDALWALTDCDAALHLLDTNDTRSSSSPDRSSGAGTSRGSSGVDGGGVAAPGFLATRARIRKAQALKALGQLQCASATLAEAAARHPAECNRSDDFAHIGIAIESAMAERQRMREAHAQQRARRQRARQEAARAVRAAAGNAGAAAGSAPAAATGGSARARAPATPAAAAGGVGASGSPGAGPSASQPTSSSGHSGGSPLSQPASASGAAVTAVTGVTAAPMSGPASPGTPLTGTDVTGMDGDVSEDGFIGPMPPPDSEPLGAMSAEGPGAADGAAGTASGAAAARGEAAAEGSGRVGAIVDENSERGDASDSGSEGSEDEGDMEEGGDAGYSSGGDEWGQYEEPFLRHYGLAAWSQQAASLTDGHSHGGARNGHSNGNRGGAAGPSGAPSTNTSTSSRSGWAWPCGYRGSSRGHKHGTSHAGGNSPDGDGGDAAAVTGAYGSLSDYMPGGRRLLQRYVGHCNVQTDIKEACFVGAGDAVVAAGSDDGCVVLYDAATGTVLRALEADEDVANCVQCHPTEAVLATSGIESVVRLWSPGADVPEASPEQLARVVARNQERMRDGPQVLRSSGLHSLMENPQLLQLILSQVYGNRHGAADAAGAEEAAGGAEEGDGDAEDDEQRAEVSCRVN